MTDGTCSNLPEQVRPAFSAEPTSMLVFFSAAAGAAVHSPRFQRRAHEHDGSRRRARTPVQTHSPPLPIDDVELIRRNWHRVRADTVAMFDIPSSKTTPFLGIRRRSPCLTPDSQTLDPKIDIVFKLLFAAEKNRHLLIKLLSAVLKPPSPIAEVRVLDAELDPSEYGDRRAVLHILAAFKDGSHVGIEMQARAHGAIEERLVFHWAQTFSGQLGAGDPYTKLRPVIGIYFFDFLRLPTARLHSTFHISEDHDDSPLTDALELHILELPKARAGAASGAPPNTLHGDSTDALVHWCRFLAAKTDKEQASIAMANPDILEAKTRLNELSADPKARRLAENRLLWEWEYLQDIDGAERRGRKRGLRDGREEGLRDGLLTALASLCEVLGLELTEERSAEHNTATLPELESVLAALRRDRAWPQ